MDTSNFAQSDMASLLMAVQTAVVVIDVETQIIVFANVRAAEIKGVLPEDMVGRHCHNYICFTEKGQCPVCDNNKKIFDEPTFMLRADGSRCPIIKSVKPISLNGSDYLLETYIDSTKINDTSEKLYWRFRKHIELQKLLLMPGSLMDKLDLICRSVMGVKELETVEIWIDSGKVPLCEKQRSESDSPLVLCSRSGSGQMRFSQWIFSLFKEENPGFKRDTRMSGMRATALILGDPGVKKLGVLAFYYHDEFTEEVRSFTEDIAETATQVIHNSLSEYRLNEALELTEKANRLMEGREARIRDIKNEINELTAGLGWGKVYENLGDEDFSESIDMSDMMELRKNALSLAEDAEIERQKAVEAHRQLILIRHAVNSSNDSIVITLGNGDIYFTNHTFDDMFGYPAARIMMTRQEELFTDSELFWKIQNLIGKGKSWSGTTEVKKYDESVLPVMLRVSTIRDDENLLLGSIWHYIDITQQIINQKRIQDDLKEKKELLRKAMILQNSYIQKTIPLLDAFNLEALFYPCEDLGGDFFRILKGMQEDKLILIMGDCTDHGIKASMDASLLLSLTDPLLHLLYESSRTDLFLAEVSRLFSMTADDDQFPTMFVMVIDCGKGIAHYSSANSTNPLILRDGKISELPRAGGMHIGYEDIPRYERKSYVFREGDRLCLFSDALTESSSGGKLHFDLKHIRKLFNHEEENSASLFGYIVDHLSRNSKDFNTKDDTTLILLDYRPPRHLSYEFSDLEEWKDALLEIKGIMVEYDFNEREIVPLSIALDEMSINAFVHGNKCNRALKVTVEGKVSCSGIDMRISDEGDGFDFLEVPDPADILEELLDEDCEDEYTHGRGIWISNKYMDFIEFSEKGNSVFMSMKKKQRHVLISEDN